LYTVLEDPFKSAWHDKDPFAEACNLQGVVYRAKEGRRTIQFTFADRSWFLKYHQGVGWKEIIKNLLQLRLPVLGASNEYEAALTLGSLGVDTLTPVAFGKRGVNPAKQESFLICQDLENTVSLEDYCRNWEETPPSFKEKNWLIKKVAETTRLMHQEGINHRDYYICHFLIPRPFKYMLQQNEYIPCYLIDLHRCQQRKQVPHRWKVKDLSGLYYSVMDIGLNQRDIFRFLKVYTGTSLREALKHLNNGIEISEKAFALYRKDFGRMPATPPIAFGKENL